MSERIKAVRDTSQVRTAGVEAPSAPPSSASEADLDALLDEIDAALEPNAEEFVRDYVQKGGE